MRHRQKKSEQQWKNPYVKQKQHRQTKTGHKDA
jgi:hypothetical protein